MVMLEMHIFHVIDIPEVSTVKLLDRIQIPLEEVYYLYMKGLKL